LHHIIPHGVPTVIRNFAYKQEGCSSWGWATYFYFMATEKKSFIIYFDLIHTVRKLPPEKAGQLFMAILKYVNDEEFELDDLLVEVVYEPIKQQLKRDLQKWEGAVERNSINGAKGGRPKKPIGFEINPNNPPVFLETQLNPPLFFETLNESVTEIVTDTDTEIVRGNAKEIVIDKKKTKQQNTSPPPREEISNPFGSSGTRIWDAWKSYKQDEHRKSYKSAKTEQQAINQLYELAGGNVETASKIVQQSIANQWQGLFELKTIKNGNQQSTKSLRERVQEEFNRRYPDEQSEGR
jgi:hypothetical protein